MVKCLKNFDSFGLKNSRKAIDYIKILKKAWTLTSKKIKKINFYVF